MRSKPPDRDQRVLVIAMLAVACGLAAAGLELYIATLRSSTEGPGLMRVAALLKVILVGLALYLGYLSLQAVRARRRLTKLLVETRRSFEEVVRHSRSKLDDVNQQLRHEAKARRRMEAAVRESEEKYRLLVENANEAIFILQDDQIKFTNPKAEEILNRLAIYPTGANLAKCIHPHERDKVIEWYQRRLEGKELPYSLMFRLEGENSTSIWVELNSILIKLNGEAATLNFIRDVTLQKKLEEQFYQSQKMESIGTLAGGIAHDFNNLLMGIQGNVSVMNLEIEDENPLQESLQSIARCVQSGSQLTNQLLAFARGGKYIVKPSDLNAIVKKSSDIFGRTKREINIHRVFATDIWPVEVDSGQIEQVLMNRLRTSNWMSTTPTSRPSMFAPGAMSNCRSRTAA